MRRRLRWPGGLLTGALLLALAPVAGLAPVRPAAAQTAPPNLGAEVLTYGQDLIPDASKPDTRIRNFYMRSVAGGDAKQITTLGNVWYQNWAPDAKQIALGTEGLTLYTMNPDGSNLQALANGVYSNPFWSPDARFIAYLGGEGWAETPLSRGDLWIIPRAGGAAWKVPGATGIPSLPAGVAWAPDATRIAAGFPGHIFDLTENGAAPAPLPGDGAGMWVLGGGWSPDGRYLAVTDGNRWGVLTLATGHFTEIAHAAGKPGTIKGGASWSPQLRKVVLAISSPGGEGQRVFTANFDGSAPQEIWSAPHVADPRHGEISSIGPPNVSPSGQQALMRVSRTTAQAGRLIFTHETWLLHLAGGPNTLLIPSSFNAVWRPKLRFPSADPAFFNTWRQADNGVALGQAARPWFWGPKPITSTLEPWSDSPSGNRLVEYYDKGRMELSTPNAPRPSRSYVTSGLLAKELVTGQIQVGPGSFTARAPAAVVVAGDAANNPAPTYATFTRLGAGTDAGKAPDRTGQHVDTVLAREAVTSTDPGLGAGALYAHYVPESGHNISSAFWGWLQAQANWVALLGYPISEPYWVHATVGGQADRPVLVQIFERRTLTFDVQNPVPWRIELGNVGQQYLAWRYGAP